MLKYKGILGRVTYDDDKETFYGKLVGIADNITFETIDIGDIEYEFQVAVNDYLEACQSRGINPNVDLSSEIMINIGQQRHRDILKITKLKDIELSEWLLEAIDEKLKRDAYDVVDSSKIDKSALNFS
ncbi:MAG: type II toxin-antitoxin system HicB family antitoxin [Bacteriovoracaceae bacterium]|nr:type II toxin-antitoxin system HicB family antitoxin [Bacteriovoracaceae bacterium]